MPPSTTDSFMLALAPGKRQSIPTCATSCVLQADLGGCASLEDGNCLCQSQTFINSVEGCFESSCSTVGDLNTAYTYAWDFCSRFGYTLPTTSYTALPSATATQSSAASSSEAAAPSSSAAVSTAPAIPPTLFEIQSIRPVAIAMPTVCSFVLLLTLVLGILSCRSKIARDRRDAQSRSWTGIGSTRMDSSRGGAGAGSSTSRFGFKRSKNAAQAREALSFQTASGTQSGFGFDKSSHGAHDWDDKSQLRSYSFGNVRAGQDRSYGLMSIDETDVRLGESSNGSGGSGGSVGEEFVLPVLNMDGDGPSPTRSEMTMDSKAELVHAK